MLTDFGKELSRRIEPIFIQLHDVEERLLHNPPSDRATIKIGTQSATLDAWLGDCIKALLSAYPNVHIILSEHNDIPGAFVKEVDFSWDMVVRQCRLKGCSRNISFMCQ